MIDVVRNFAKVIVSTGYDAVATSIVLNAGHGARLPTPATEGAFNLTYWNSTDFSDPADDPNREIVRCTARTTDTLTVIRAQEGTAATIKNIAGKIYMMVLSPTRKTIDDIRSGVVINKNRVWIAHGNNVITFPTAHSNNNYRWVATLSQAPMGGITPRNVGHTRGLSVFLSNESPTRGRVRIEGGFGFTSSGNLSNTERFDDVANTHTARAATTARENPAGYSLNGFGFTSLGSINVHERFDDVANIHTARVLATARSGLAGYSLNGFGFTSCGSGPTGLTERFDDVANTHTARADATARENLAGYSLNGFGFTSCGRATGNAIVGTTERFDDVANTHTARAATTARENLAGYSLNGFGFTSLGWSNITERFDDVANTHTARAVTTNRAQLAGYSLNGFGFTSCGFNAVNVGTTERFDDIANTHTARTDATARNRLTSYSLNEYFINFLTFNE